MRLIRGDCLVSLNYFTRFHNLTTRASLSEAAILCVEKKAVVAVSMEGGYELMCSLKSRSAFHVKAEEPKTRPSVSARVPPVQRRTKC